MLIKLAISQYYEILGPVDIWFICYKRKNMTKNLRNIVALVFSIAVTNTSNALPLQMELSAGIPFFFNDSNNKLLHVSRLETDTLKQHCTYHRPSYHFGINQGILESPFGILSLGGHVYYQEVKYKGDVLQLGLPELNNYTYHLVNRLINVLLETRLQFQSFQFPGHKKQTLMPYFFAGVGAGSHSLNYHDFAKPGITGGEVHVANTKHNAVADIGVGIDLPLNKCFSLGAKYLIMFNGTSSTSKHGDIGLERPLRINSNNQSIMLDLTYQMDNPCIGCTMIMS